MEVLLIKREANRWLSSSRALSPAEKNYAMTDLETIAVVWEISNYFRHYLIYNQHVRVYRPWGYSSHYYSYLGIINNFTYIQSLVANMHGLRKHHSCESQLATHDHH